MDAAASAPRLICPGCGAAYGSDHRFCERCRLPLVLDAPELVVSDRHDRARKIKPQLAEGRLISVARAGNQPEAELIQGLLLEEGVPSLVRRSAGFDVPDFLAAGPRDVLVPQSGVETARETLLAAEIIADAPPGAGRTPPVRLLAGLLLALAVGALLVWALGQGIH
jgi:hypothetical protein